MTDTSEAPQRARPRSRRSHPAHRTERAGAATRTHRRPRTRGAAAAPTSRRSTSTTSGPTRSNRARSSTRTSSPSWSDSIREVGLLQPIVVRPLVEEQSASSWSWGSAACARRKLAGRGDHPRDRPRTPSEHDLLRDALLENLHRANLNPLEEAAAYQQLLDDFGCTQEELVRAHQALAAADLQHDPPAQAPGPGAAAGRRRRAVSRATPARCWRLADPAEQERLAQRIVAEGLSVRAVEEIVATGQRPRQPVRRATAPRTPARAPAALAGAPDRRPGHPGQRRHRTPQGQDHHRVRVGRRPGPDPRHHARRNRHQD